VKTILLIVLSTQIILMPYAMARGGHGGGMGMGHSMMGGMTGGGALGTSAGAPGTNSLGTAVPSGGGPAMATAAVNPVVTPQDKALDQRLLHICRGC
jgi:hypothetical protein